MTEFPRGWDPAAELPRGSDPTVELDWGWDPTAVSQGLTVDLPLVISLLISMDTAPKHLVSRTSLASSSGTREAAGKPGSREGQCLKIPNFVQSQLCPFPMGIWEFTDPRTSPAPTPQNSSISAACAGILMDLFCFLPISWNFAFFP